MHLIGFDTFYFRKLSSRKVLEIFKVPSFHEVMHVTAASIFRVPSVSAAQHDQIYQVTEVLVSVSGEDAAVRMLLWLQIRASETKSCSRSR